MPSQTLITLVALMLAGCNGATAVSPSATATATANSTAELELGFDEFRDYQDLRLRLLSIDDSRCAIGLTCVWAGQMLAVIGVVRGDDAEVEVSLRTRVGSEPEVASALGYEFSLIALEPHPKNNVTINRREQSLRLMVNKP